jgi:hypothetical protein
MSANLAIVRAYNEQSSIAFVVGDLREHAPVVESGGASPVAAESSI